MHEPEASEASLESFTPLLITPCVMPQMHILITLQWADEEVEEGGMAAACR